MFIFEYFVAIPLLSRSIFFSLISAKTAVISQFFYMLSNASEGLFMPETGNSNILSISTLD